ncbi:MAG: hypothetical protein AAFU53_14140 [Cyanobacteria bacterium J06632_3]
MKRYILSALTVAVTAVAAAPAVQAFEPTLSLQEQRLEQLDTKSKAVSNIQAERLNHLDTQTKAVKDIQSTRLGHLDSQTKTVR